MCIMVKNRTIELKTPSHTYDTRHRNLAISENLRTKTLQNNVDFMASKIYNKIPQEFKSLTSGKLFKNKLKKWLQGYAFYSIDEMVQLE